MAIDAAERDREHALHFERLAAIRAFYVRTWEDWYRTNPHPKPAALVIDESDHMSIYRPERDVICLCVTQDQMEQEASDIWPWPTWKIELVHEMPHEWEQKAVAAPSAAGEALWRANLGRFAADHQAPFFTAIVDKATYFGLAPEELIATL